MCPALGMMVRIRALSLLCREREAGGSVQPWLQVCEGMQNTKRELVHGSDLFCHISLL